MRVSFDGRKQRRFEAGVPNMKQADWDDYRIFLAVARGGTLRRAAEVCRLAPATLSRRLSDIEANLGGRLFDRLPTGCFLTDFGRQVLGWVERMDDLTLEIARLGDTAFRGEPSGRVRINADEWLAYVVMLNMGRLLERHPALEVEVAVSGRPQSLTRRETDLVLSRDRPQEGGAVTRNVGVAQFGLFSSREYAVRHADDLAGRNWAALSFVGLSDARDTPEERWLRSLPGNPVPRLRCSYGLGVYDGVAGGAGLGLVAHSVGDRDDRLVPILSRIPELAREVWLAYHETSRGSRRIRVAADHLIGLFA
jgi:DNA-binding transcriptional LysR family regulator